MTGTPRCGWDDRNSAIELLQKIAAPILKAARGNGLAQEMPVEILPGSTRNRAIHSPLEAVGRLLCGIAPFLERQALEGGPEAISLADVHYLLAVSTDPTSPHKLNFSSGQQALVDAAFLAQAILRAPTALWSSLPSQTQDQLLRSLRHTRKFIPPFNNWLLFSALIEAFFCKVEQPWDRVRVEYAIRQTDEWYVGDGLYSDGPNFHFDYYNSYVIYPMILDVLLTVSSKNKHLDRFLAEFRPRLGRYAEILERLIGPDGSFPPIGRSLTYRCAAFQPLAQLALREELPDTLPPGQIRAALMAVIERTLASPANYDEAGWLRIGLNGSQPELAESYISTGSLYLCSTAFLPLGLPEGSRFWSEPALPWSQKKIWSLGENLVADKAYNEKQGSVIKCNRYKIMK